MKLTDPNKQLIRATITHVQALREHVHELWRAGYSVDSERTEEVNQTIDEIIKSTEAHTQTDGWIKWFVYENQCVERGHVAGYHGQTIAVHTADDLFAVIQMR